MTKNSNRLFAIAVALLLLAFIAVDANAQCCGATAGYAPAYTAAYAPAYTSYYAPAYGASYAPAYSASYAPAYTSYYGGGWYPGYWMDRVRARLWGSPSTYVAAYPTTYAASYAPNYAVSYGGYATSYAAPACPSCSGCSTCGSCSSCSASYAPSCSTCGSSCGCESCSASYDSGGGGSCCSAPAATQASYQAPQSCGCGYNNGGQPAYAQQNSAPVSSPPIVAGPGTTVIQQNGAPSTPDPRPAIEANQQSPPQSTYRNMPTESVQPTPHPEYDVKKTDNSSYLEAPKLFNPRDRTAQRSIAPVRTALYEQPVSYRGVSASRTTITAQQAQKDAVGWTSASN